MSALAQGQELPGLTLLSTEGPVELRERWRNGPLVLAFMRHFG
jgi:hypothetical protein